MEILTISDVAVDFGSWYYKLGLVLMYSNSFINPFIYTAKYREFQRGVRRLLSKMNLIQQQPQVASATPEMIQVSRGPHTIRVSAARNPQLQGAQN